MVVVDRPIPNRHLQMAFVEGNQKVQTFATKTPAQSFAYGVGFRGSYWRPQNSYTQIRQTLVDVFREDAVAIVDEEAI